MNEMYWFTVIGNFEILMGIILACSLVALVATIGILVIHNEDDGYGYQLARKLLKGTIVAIVISLLGVIFIPSKEDLYVIYGVGSTIDYIKSNDKAKQLPDKAIEALDTWLKQNTKEK